MPSGDMSVRRRSVSTSRRWGLAPLTLLLLGVGTDLWAQDLIGPRLLLPGDEYTRDEIPAAAAGRWLALIDTDGSSRLADVIVRVVAVHDACIDSTPDERSGRIVTVPGTTGVLFLVRGVPGLTVGPVPTATLSQTVGQLTDTVGINWTGGRSRVLGESVGDGFRVLLTTGAKAEELYRTEWTDDGSWALRWAGDVNGDGRLDLLLDATHKYSVATQRLFLSSAAGLTEVASFTQTSC